MKEKRGRKERKEGGRKSEGEERKEGGRKREGEERKKEGGRGIMGGQGGGSVTTNLSHLLHVHLG